MSHEDDLGDLHDRIDRQVQSFERAAASADPITVADEPGTIELRVSADGEVEQVTIRESWRHHYEPEDLGAAVLQVYTQAGSERLHEWSTRLASDADEVQGRTRPIPAAHETVVGRLEEAMAPAADIDADASLDALAGLLREVRDGLDDTVRMVTERTAATYEGRSSQGAVRASVNGAGVLTELTYDPTRLTNRHAFNISRETQEAVAAARAAARAATPSDPLASTPIADAIRTVQDPQALAQRLRLLG